MQRPSLLVEYLEFHPAEIERIAGRPDDCRHAGLGEVEGQHRTYQAIWIRFLRARSGVRRQVEAMIGRVVVRGVQYREVVRITPGNVVDQIESEVHRPVLERPRPTQQRYAPGSKAA